MLFEESGRIEMWRDGDTERVVDSLDQEDDSRFNDVIADPKGRVFCGTMPTDDRAGRLYRLDRDGSLALLRNDVALPNGLGFAPDRESLYFAETTGETITRYAYAEETGTISDPESFVAFTGEEGSPDGMTVDATGSVWVALWNGGCLVRYNSDGTERERVSFPARKVSSLTFGGLNYTRAYVTTARGPAEGAPGSREVEGDGAGALFGVDLGVRGLPEFRSRIGL